MRAKGVTQRIEQLIRPIIVGPGSQHDTPAPVYVPGWFKTLVGLALLKAAVFLYLTLGLPCIGCDLRTFTNQTIHTRRRDDTLVGLK